MNDNRFNAYVVPDCAGKGDYIFINQQMADQSSLVVEPEDIRLRI